MCVSVCLPTASPASYNISVALKLNFIHILFIMLLLLYDVLVSGLVYLRTCTTYLALDGRVQQTKQQ